MANTITQIINNFPQAPNSATDNEAQFNLKADAWVAHMAQYVIEVNNWATEANAFSNDVNVVGNEITNYVKKAGGVFTDMPKVGVDAIISSGSNANGSWIKYGDGTIIINGTRATSAVPGTPKGALFISAVFSVTLPIPLISSTYIILTEIYIPGSSAIGGIKYYGNKAVTTFDAVIWSTNNTSPGGALTYAYTVIGRWKV